MIEEVKYTKIICDGCGRDNDSALSDNFFNILGYDFCQKCYPTFINDMINKKYITNEMVEETMETFEVFP